MKKVLGCLGLALCAALVFSSPSSAQKAEKFSRENGNPAFTLQKFNPGLASLKAADRELTAGQKPAKPGKSAPAGFRPAVKSAENPLFFCDFATEASMDQWIALDSNHDGLLWGWYDGWDVNWDENSGSGWISYSATSPLDDYLVTANPVSLKTGPNYISFYYRCPVGTASWGYMERMEVLYGKSPDVDEMQQIWLREFNDEEYQYALCEIPLEEDGDYYFAFHAISDQDQMGFNIDNVTIDTGAAPGTPDIAVELVLPVSSCDLTGTERIGARVANAGTQGIHGFTLSYTVNDSWPATEQTFDFNLPVGTDTLVYFDQTADFSTPGQYLVELEASLDGTETVLENNTAQGSVFLFEPAEIPFKTDFSEESGRNDWTFQGNDWVLDSAYLAMAPGASVGNAMLYSRCINMEEGRTYRLELSYKAGLSYSGLYTYYDSIDVLIGKIGDPENLWDTIGNVHHLYTDEAFTTYSTVFESPASGQYSIAIRSINPYSDFRLRSASVDTLSAHDVRINSFGGLALMMPEEHVNNTLTTFAEVENRGQQATEAVVAVSSQGSEIGQKTVTLDELNTPVPVEIEIQPSGLTAGTEAVFTAEISIPGTEDPTPDNQCSTTVLVTEDVFGYDTVSEDMYNADNAVAVGEGLYVGMLFDFPVSDTLTGVSLGWGAADNQDIEILVLKYDAEESTAEQVVGITLPQGLQAGQIVYGIQPTVLEAGSYLIMIGATYAGLVCDFTDPSQSRVYGMMENFIAPLGTFGNAAIRAVFSHDTEILAHDATAESIVKPAETGFFATNETVEVQVRNWGSENDSIPVNLLVNGQLQTQTIFVESMQTGVATFTADLSAPSTEYELVAFTSLESDEDRSNDTCRKTVTTLPAPDPYVMDFEYCADFAIDNFTPAWRSVDNDQQLTYGIQTISYPHKGEAYGFMAFNPFATTPAMNNPDILPHGGTRFGGAFATTSGRNDDWLISPALALPETDANLNLWVRSYQDTYGTDQYRILVSSTENLEDFVVLKDTTEAPMAWTEVNVPLDDYAGQTVYLAIQCVSPDRFLFMVDDIRVSKPEASTCRPETLESRLKLYPNPATETIVINAAGTRINHVGIFNLSGRMVYNSANLDTDNFRFNVTELTSGMYFARVKTGQGSAVLKFVVK